LTARRLRDFCEEREIYAMATSKSGVNELDANLGKRCKVGKVVTR
jgi:hypothetical protein